ncbi:hypothetical protein CSUB01_01360 [Colletotrichum sublineola]|uniref:Rhodopsin domain-containing protein n=1 Tax=Colletotrichum sublineola TaxID=1173701 RepID=A0A066X5R3_COLSU|nr:hypothetical protein CSUB01_01360 [Colletotrichum sublineola]
MDLENANGPRLDEVGGPNTLVTTIWGVNLTAFIFVGIIVPLRVVVRCTVTRKFFNDDVLVIIAAIFTFGICSLLPLATDLGLGQHSSDIDAADLADNTKYLFQLLFIANILYPCAIAFARLSAVCSFLRPVEKRNARWTLFATAVVTGAFALASVFAVIFQCKPISAAWDPTVSGASCYPFLDFLHASTAINIAIDAVLCTMPLAYFLGMTMSLREKVLVTFLFAIAGLSCVAGIIKIVYLQPLDQADVTSRCLRSFRFLQNVLEARKKMLHLDKKAKCQPSSCPSTENLAKAAQPQPALSGRWRPRGKVSRLRPLGIQTSSPSFTGCG